MKILRKIFIGVVILIAIPLIIALFIKKTYSVEQEIMINKSKQEVFDYLKFLKNQNYYSKWATMDPNMTQEYKGTDANVGFVSSWNSAKKDVGQGEQTITKITEGERIDYEIHFIKPFEGRAIAFMTMVPVSDNQTKVKWGFKSKMKYPMNLMLLFMNMDKMIGNDLAIGLSNLKNVLESK